MRALHTIWIGAPALYARVITRSEAAAAYSFRTGTCFAFRMSSVDLYGGLRGTRKKKRESRDRRAKNAAKRGREDEETTTSGCSLLDENDEVKKQKVEEEPTKEDTEEAVAVT